MDNLTHSLAGLVIGDAAILLRQRFGSGKAPGPGFRGAALTTGVLSSNGPDLDFVYTGITAGKLGYLLHHRGHTHTLVAALPLTLLVVSVAALALRLAGLRLTASDYRVLVGLGAVGSVLHVLMDFGNNYGVHPFWPVSNAWYYGDAIFIVDPWFLLILGGMALSVGASRVLTGVLLASMAGLVALAWVSGLTGAWLASGLTLFAVLWVRWLWRATPRRRWRSGGAALLCLWVALLGTRHVARANVRAALELDPTLSLMSLASTPAPGNPLCWSLLAVQQGEGEYVVRQALAAGWPWLSSAEACRFWSTSTTAPLSAPRPRDGIKANRQLVWGPEFRAPLAELSSTRRDDCVAAAFLRFARIPYWIRRGERSAVIGDLRFDRSKAIEFAELVLTPGAPCPRFEPPWSPPLPWLEDGGGR